jgi:hypothetical protein
LANNKTLTREPSKKKKNLDDVSYLFCAESEFVTYLFFECCIAKAAWECIIEITHRQVGQDFESVARCQMLGWWKKITVSMS